MKNAKQDVAGSRATKILFIKFSVNLGLAQACPTLPSKVGKVSKIGKVGKVGNVRP